MGAPESPGARPERGSRRAAIGVLVLTVAALAIRLHSIDYALPNYQAPDPHVFAQVDILGRGELSPEELEESSIYPHLLARMILLLTDAPGAPEGAVALPPEAHLEAAGRRHVQIRTLISLVSVLLIPAAYWIARRFLKPWPALLAAALTATSLLSLQFAQMVRPHAMAAPLTCLVVVASLRLRARPTLGSFVLAGLAAGTALACLQNAAPAMFSLALAYLLRDGVGPLRRFLDWRALAIVGLVFLAFWFFYPFLFVSASSESMAVESGQIRVSSQSVDLSGFNGDGLPTLFMTLWYYEPASLVLAILGLVLFCLRIGRPDEPAPPGRGKDLAIVLAYAVPYAVVLALYERTQQRFVIPLVPFVACSAAFGVLRIVRALTRGASRPARRWVGVAAGLLALALPAYATARYAWIHANPHTLQQAAAWIEANVDRETERVGVHALYDLPLVRQRRNLVDDDGTWRKVIYSPWQHYQAKWLPEDWSGERWDMPSLYPPGEVKLQEVIADPGGYIEGLGVRYVVLPGGGLASQNPVVKGVRGAVSERGTLVAFFPKKERMRPTLRLEGLDTPHYTAFLLTTENLGPALEIWRVESD